MIRGNVEKRISSILDNGDYILGSDVHLLEKKLAEYVGVEECITCASGTDALLIPLMAQGIGPGDAVFTSSFSFFATAEVISLVGAHPVFVDIDEKTFNIDPILLEKEIQKVVKNNRLKPKCIIPVDLFGLLADYEKIMEIAKKYNLFVVEDAAQSFGASFNNKNSCSFGHVSGTSFYPAKPLGCYGDGGAIFTNDIDLSEKYKSIRVHGQGLDKYNNERIGLNSRLDSIQAAILICKMQIFDDEIKRRNEIAEFYSNELNQIVTTPYVNEKFISSWAQYSILTESEKHREIIIDSLKKHNIPSVIYYKTPLHLQNAFKQYGYKQGDFPISEKTSRRILSLPMHPYLNIKELNDVVEAIKEI